MLSEIERRLHQNLDERTLVGLLADLVKLPSVSGDERAVVERLDAFLRGSGFFPTIEEAAPGRPNLVCQWGNGEGPVLLLTGHTDTVPIGEGWTTDPFGAAIKDGKLYGRGSCDMKAGLAGMALTMTAARAAFPQPAGTVVFAACVDEEETGIGTQAAIRNGLAADCAVIGEPTELQVVRACKGDCYFQVEVTGRAAHAGSPEQGANAIYRAAEAIQAARLHNHELGDRRHALLGHATLSVGTIKGGMTTSAVPDRCDFWVDRRLLPGETGAQALGDFRKALQSNLKDFPGTNWNASLRMELPPSEVNEAHPLVAFLHRAARDSGAPDLPVGGWSAASDGGYLMRDAEIPTVLFGPGSIVQQAHRPDEYVALDQVVTATRTYMTLAARALAGAMTDMRTK